TGSQLWNAFYRASQHYYVPDHERILIQREGPRMAQQSDADTVVDFGVGSDAFQSKVLPILSGLPQVRLYSGIDTAQDFLKQVAQEVANDRPDLKVELHHADYHASPLPLGGRKRLGLLFGCSATNHDMMEGQDFPEEAVIQSLRDFRHHLGPGSEMLLTYDENGNEESVRACYDHPDCQRHAMGILEDIARELQRGGDFDPQAWTYKAIWNPELRILHHCIVASKAQTLLMDDREYAFQRGERFVVINNFKLSRERFDHLCSEAGFSLRQLHGYQTLRLQHLAIDS
ncbi:MAG: L-histidine N(alpha)-methyltransferase, partial [Verrucomicrobiota bacterium]